MTKQRMHLGEILFKAGLVEKQALINAIKTAKSSNKRLGQVLLQLGLINEDTLAKAIAKQFGLKYDSPEGWPEREQLDRTCTEAWEELAGALRQNGDLQAAVQACQEALKIDPSRENIHRLAMNLHAELGDKLGIIWQYRACREALRSELDINPSIETEALYQRLTA